MAKEEQAMSWYQKNRAALKEKRRKKKEEEEREKKKKENLYFGKRIEELEGREKKIALLLENCKDNLDEGKYLTKDIINKRITLLKRKGILHKDKPIQA